MWREGEKGKQMWFKDFFHLIFKTTSHHPNSIPAGVNWSSAIDCSGSRARSVHEAYWNHILIWYIIESFINNFCSLLQFLKLKTIRHKETPWILKWTMQISTQVCWDGPSDSGVCWSMQRLVGLMPHHQTPSLRGLRDTTGGTPFCDMVRSEDHVKL